MTKVLSNASNILLVLFCLHHCTCHSHFKKLKDVFKWKALDFEFESDQQKQNAIKSGNYIPGAPVPIDVDVYYPGLKVFVSIPRFQDGVPATLGYVTNKVSPDGNPIIAPYPNWSWQTLGNCDAMTSVYRMQIDSCGRLWVLDTGKLGDNKKCSPQLLCFSLQNDTLLKRIRIPDDVLHSDNLLVTPVVDIRNNDCGNPYVYMADVNNFKLLVYGEGKVWSISNKLFYPYPPAGTFHIRNDSFELMDGILGLALGPIKNQDRTLYFHSLASFTESYVQTSVIRNYNIFSKQPDAVPEAFKSFQSQRSSQSAAEAFDKNGVLFYGLMSDLSIGCWNSAEHPIFDRKVTDIAVHDPDTLQFASGLKVVSPESGRQELWVLTSSFQKYMTGTLSPNVTNFRIQAGYVDELIRETKCQGKSFNAIIDTNGQHYNYHHVGGYGKPSRNSK